LHTSISSFLIPTVFFVLQESVELTVQAEPVVAADRATACGAAPLFTLGGQKTLHPVIPDGIEVFDHAHVVFRAVALIQAF